MAHSQSPTVDFALVQLLRKIGKANPSDSHERSFEPSYENGCLSRDVHRFRGGGTIIRAASGEGSLRMTKVVFVPSGAGLDSLESKRSKEGFDDLFGIVETMFATNCGQIFLGKFFDPRFKLSQRLKQQLELQSCVPWAELVRGLNHLLAASDSADQLREICSEHLDKIQTHLRMRFPFEEIRLGY